MRCFIHASTGGVYGCRDRPFVETDPFNPLDLYSLTKSQAELAVRHTPTPFPKIILRYCFPYGMGTPNPIPTYVQRAFVGEAIAITANRKPHFNPIHIDDAVEATVRALALQEDTVLNIAGSEITTFAEIAEFAAQRAGRQPNFTLLADDEVIPYYRATSSPISTPCSVRWTSRRKLNWQVGWLRWWMVIWETTDGQTI